MIKGAAIGQKPPGSTDTNPERRMVAQEMVEREIAKAKKAKAEHSGEKAGPKRRIGFR